MKNLRLILPLFFTLAIHTQELDETFLKSLPNDIRDDVIDRAENQDSTNEDNYRSYQYSSQLKFPEDLVSLKERLEADLEELKDRLESDQQLIIDTELTLFGSDFFSTFQTSFMPTNEPNPDSSYSLDVGDVLTVQLIGQQNSIETFELSGDGSINLPNIGKIFLAGLTLENASSIIKSKVNASFIGTESFVSLDRIRDVNVLVTGNSMNPGIYTLTGNSNILHALTMAGGVNEFGSFREINLIRNNNIIETLDVYDLLINGKYNLKKRLRSGDVIFVEARKNVVTIDGAVKRPAKFEILDNQFLDSIIKYANGLKQTADIQNIYLERILDGSMTSIPVVNKSQFTSIKAIDGDLIYVREFPYRTAKVTGAVLKPGTYTMAAGETIDDLISKAGGYTQNAYPFGAVYENNDAKIINMKSKDILYEEFLDNIIALSQQSISESFNISPIVSLTEEIKNAEPNGRIVIDLINENMSDMVTIRDGDELLIPEKNNNVYVYGETSTEGAVMFVEGQDVEYFVDKSGGFKSFADTESIYILHPNGETESFSKKRNIFESSPSGTVKIYPGSIIFVPRKLDNSASRRLATQAYVSILGSLGIALASLSSINNN